MWRGERALYELTELGGVGKELILRIGVDERFDSWVWKIFPLPLSLFQPFSP